MGVDDKPGIGYEPYPQRVEGAVGDLDDLVADFTDQVMVDIIGQMPAGGAVADVDVKGDIEPFEQLEGAIDGGQVDIGVLGPYRVGQLFSGEVVIAVVEGFDHRPSVDGDPSTGEPDRLDGLIDPFRRHLGERSGREWNGGWISRKGLSKAGQWCHEGEPVRSEPKRLPAGRGVPLPHPLLLPQVHAAAEQCPERGDDDGSHQGIEP